MDFRERQAIYLQIVDYVCEQILLKQWLPENKIVSIRDLAVSMQVNPNTVQRAYDFLQQREIIANKRGIGYFVEGGAVAKVIAFKKEQFLAHELPVFLKSMYLLGISAAEIDKQYQKFIKDNFTDNKHEN